jgi:CTP:molybdopterin cytidylyltransferase MocA
LVAWQADELRQAGAAVVIVVAGDRAEEIISAVTADGIEPIVNERWEAGESSSVRVGATATPRDTTAAVIVWLDQPCTSDVIRAVLEEHNAAKAHVARPFVGDLPAHPVCVDAGVLARLRNMADDERVDDVLREYDTLVVRTLGSR